MVDLQRLGQTEVFDTAGRPRALAVEWAHKTAVLIFLRHFG